MTRRLSLDFVRAKLQESGYRLLDDYVSSSTPMQIACDRGHEFPARWNSFQQGHRCGQCYHDRRALDIHRVRAAFRAAGCELLTGTFPGANTPMPYVCQCGRRSTIRWVHFVSGERCRGCSSDKKRHNLEHAREVFRRGGCVLLAGVYVNNKAKMRYACERGHESAASLHGFRGCPRCRSRKR